MRGAWLPTLLILLWLPAAPAGAAWEPEGVDLTRPRVLFRAAQLPAIQAKLDMEPLPEPFAVALERMRGRIDAAEGIPLDDHLRGPARDKAKAARNLAFLYAVDRTWTGSEVRRPTPAERRAMGERVQELLLHMYTRSRLAVPPPLGGWDRDITTSEEILMYATAYDALLGAGWDFGADHDAITTNLVDLVSELVDNYANTGLADIHQNNHRTKSGTSFVVAGLALAEYEPAPGSDPLGVRDPAFWIGLGLFKQVQQAHNFLVWFFIQRLFVLFVPQLLPHEIVKEFQIVVLVVI